MKTDFQIWCYCEWKFLNDKVHQNISEIEIWYCKIYNYLPNRDFLNEKLTKKEIKLVSTTGKCKDAKHHPTQPLLCHSGSINGILLYLHLFLLSEPSASFFFQFSSCRFKYFFEIKIFNLLLGTACWVNSIGAAGHSI